MDSAFFAGSFSDLTEFGLKCPLRSDGTLPHNTLDKILDWKHYDLQNLNLTPSSVIFTDTYDIISLYSCTVTVLHIAKGIQKCTLWLPPSSPH